MARILTVFRLIGSPQAEWSRIFGNSSSGTLEMNMYYPLVGILAVSAFMSLVYDPLCTLHSAIIDAVVLFVSFFLGYVVVSFLISMLLPKIQQPGKVVSDGRVRTFVMYNMSVMVLIEIVKNFLPVSDMPLMYLFLLYILYLISKGSKYFFIEQERTVLFVVGAFCLIVSMPALFSFVLRIFIPSV